MTNKEILDLLKKRKRKIEKKLSKVSLYDITGFAKYTYADEMLRQIIEQIKSRQNDRS